MNDYNSRGTEFFDPEKDWNPIHIRKEKKASDIECGQMFWTEYDVQAVRLPNYAYKFKPDIHPDDVVYINKDNQVKYLYPSRIVYLDPPKGEER